LQAVDVQACAKALRCCMQMQDKARVYMSGAGLDLVFTRLFCGESRAPPPPLFFFSLSNDQYEAIRRKRPCDS
jgi:hypothetical protein